MIGVNIIPADSVSKTPKVKWTEWQDKPIPSEEYERWKSSGAFNDGCAIYMGLIWRGEHEGKYLVCIDIDNKKGIKVVLSKFGKSYTIVKLSEKTIVEQHLDAKDKKAHIYFIVDSPLSKKSGIVGPSMAGDPDIPALEVKSEGKHGLMICSPSIHKNGHPYQIIGTRSPTVLNTEHSENLERSLNEIYEEYSSLSNNPNFNLSDELRLVGITRRIGKDSPKIPQGSRSNTLISLVRVTLNQNYESMDLDDIKSFVEEVNQKLCEPPLSREELDGIWKQDLGYLLKDLESGNLRPRRSDEKGGNHSKIKSKPEFLTFKYTQKGQIYESVIVGEKPYFLTIKDEEVILESSLEEETRVLRPPAPEEYPGYIPYTFKDIDEIKNYLNLINSPTLTLDAIVTKIREQISKYIVHHDHVLDYITALTLFSYFQDKFPTVPYTMFVSDNGSGKSTIGNVFECFAYRSVNMTDPTTANIFRIFGTIEPGQCMLILDEAEKLDQEKEMMGVMKSGYENGKKIQRINPLGKQEHFHAYGIKVMLAERTPNPFYAKGILDRTFVISNYKGRPQLDIKETKNSKKGKTEISFYKNMLLLYRLSHFSENIKDIETGLEGRDKELCKPLLQHFFNTKFQPKLERTLEVLLDEKNIRKANSLEREVLEVIINLVQSEFHDSIIPISRIWNEIILKTNATKSQFDELTIVSESHGTISKNTVLKMIRDRFGAKEKRYSDARCLCFDLDKILRNYEDYIKEDKPTTIVCKLLDKDDANDVNIESLFKSFGYMGSAPPTDTPFMNGSNIEAKLIEQQCQDTGLKMKTELSFLSTSSQGLENSVISVIPVTNTQTKENMEKNNSKQVQPTNHIDNIFRKWKGRDTWACNNCNDTGDRPYMLKHPCKNNKKNL